MSSEPDPNAHTIAEPAWAECEAVIKRFEDAWRGAARPDLAAFAPADHPLRPRLLAELAHIDIELRFRHGEDVRVEDYFARFPELGGGALAVELISAEFSLRHRAGPVSRDDFLARFPQYRDALADLLPSEPGATLTGSSVRAWAPPRSVVPPSIPGYVIEDEVGRGGMGVVYRARQPGLSRVVAVKTLRGPDSGTRDRFRREAEAMARLDHPNIVPVYEVGEWRTAAGRAVPFYTMKWYSGGGLDTRPCGPGTDPAAHARIVEAVARAVHHAHQRGVLHRDLKPSNVLLDEAGEPHVADFGLAGLFDPLITPHGGATGTAVATQVGVRRAMLGTPAYMAPEQAHNPSRVTTAADVYALGAVLYHLLTGRPPFTADDPFTTLELAASAAPRPPSAANPAVPPDLEAVCLKCLAKDPAGRYASAEALADDLARWRAGSPVVARPLPAWSRAWRWGRRHGLLVAVGLTALAALVAAVVVLGVGNARVREREAAAIEVAERESRARLELDAALRREKRLLYLERVRAAGLLHAANQFPHARRLLDECPPDLRGWEWRYLDSLGNNPPAPRRTEPVDKAGWPAVSPDGTRRATGGADGVVRVWDVESGRELLALPAGGPVREVGWDGERLVALTDALLTWEPAGR